MEIYPNFYDHEVVRKSPEMYVQLQVGTLELLGAWYGSQFSYELLSDDKTVKSEDQLSDETLEKFIAAKRAFAKKDPVVKPIIGVGLMDGVEIGIGREIVCAAAVCNIQTISCFVRKAQADDVKKLLKL